MAVFCTKRFCTEPGWVGINFLHNNCMVLCVLDKTNVDNRPVFYLLWSSTLHSLKAFSSSRAAAIEQMKSWEGTEPGEPGPQMTKGIYSMPHNGMLSNQNQVGGVGLACSHCSE